MTPRGWDDSIGIKRRVRGPHHSSMFVFVFVMNEDQCQCRFQQGFVRTSQTTNQRGLKSGQDAIVRRIIATTTGTCGAGVDHDGDQTQWVTMVTLMGGGR